KIGESQLGNSSGSGGSTTCPSQAPATLIAATAARDDLFTKVAEKLKINKADPAIEKGKVVDKNGKSWSWKEFSAKLGSENARGQGEWSQARAMEADDNGKLVNPGVSSGQVGGVQVAEVVVDTETGVVRCTNIVAIQDCGMVINKLCCESQVAGRGVI